MQMDQQHGHSSGRLVDSEAEPTTILSDDSVYTSAERFEDLNLHADLLKVMSIRIVMVSHLCRRRTSVTARNQRRKPQLLSLVCLSVDNDL